MFYNTLDEIQLNPTQTEDEVDESVTNVPFDQKLHTLDYTIQNLKLHEVLENKQLNARRPLRRKCLQSYPDMIRSKIQYFEAKSSSSNIYLQTDKIMKVITSQFQSVSKVTSTGCYGIPRIIGIIFNQNCDLDNFRNSALIYGKKNSTDACQFNIKGSNCFNTIRDMQNNQRFIVNLYESQGRTDVKRSKTTIKGAIRPVNSKLYIDSVQDASTKIKDVSDTDAEVDASLILSALQEAYTYSQIWQQASKAAHASISASSEYQAEAERILLIAELKYNKVFQQICKKRSEMVQISNVVNIMLSNITVPIRSGLDHKTKVWFIMTCATDHDIYVSQLIQKTADTQYLRFERNFRFEKLDFDFVINLNIYQLKVSNANRQRRITFFNRKKRKNVASRQLRKLIFKNNGELIETEVYSSLFSFCGGISLTMEDLLASNVFALDETSKNSMLFGIFQVISRVDCVLTNNTKSGFLTVGTEINGHVVWDRKWCRLEEYVLKFWPTPSEEDINEPKLVLTLKTCVNVTICNIYTRSNTIVLEFCNVDVVTKYYLWMDTYNEFDDWNNYINVSVYSLNMSKKLHNKI